MNRHKDKALGDICLCNKCPHRFECFTQERIFSDTVLQGLFEALMAKGHTKEDALDEVATEIKARILPQSAPQPAPWIYDYSAGSISGNWHYTVNGKDITYTMTNGEVVSWSCDARFDKIR